MRADLRTTSEAAILLLLVRVGFTVGSFAAVERCFERWFPQTTPSSSDPPPFVVAERVGAAVRAASRRLHGTTCLAETLAAAAMLRRRGLTSTRKIGVRAPADGVPLDAHAWLESHGALVVGDHADLGEYRILTTR